jgi:hypothetical protein|tara:strand:+ start:243 stop:722 length:480 start_codon:yes stop_codon:yes gene_type:complete
MTIKKAKPDLNKDGKNDFKDVQIARRNAAATADKKKVKEGLGDMAHLAEQDHEVQMARAELYKIAKYAIKLHDMLKTVSEAEGIEGWQQAKITKAADYIGSVYHAMEYDQMSPATEGAKTFKTSMTEAEVTAYKTKLAKATTKIQNEFTGLQKVNAKNK